MFDQRATNHPGPGLEAANIIGIVGGDVLEIAGHRIEAKAAGGIDIAQTHPARLAFKLSK